MVKSIVGILVIQFSMKKPLTFALGHFSILQDLGAKCIILSAKKKIEWKIELTIHLEFDLGPGGLGHVGVGRQAGKRGVNISPLNDAHVEGGADDGRGPETGGGRTAAATPGDHGRGGRKRLLD